MQKSGIYQIKNLKTGKLYIGSAIKLTSRKCRHERELGNGSHHCHPLQLDWDLVSDPTLFEFSVLVYCDKQDLLFFEQRFLDYHWPIGLYNICSVAGSRIGAAISESHKKKISEAQKGRPKSKLHNLRNAKAHTGKTHSEETKEKMRLAKIGRSCSEETRLKLSESMTGRIISDEHKKKLQASLKGRLTHPSHTHTEETKKKISESMEKRKKKLPTT